MCESKNIDLATLPKSYHINVLQYYCFACSNYDQAYLHKLHMFRKNTSLVLVYDN